MEAIEIEAKSIDEAIEKACSEFQVPREKLNIEIISEGTAGFLGLGAKKAQIRASLLSIDMTLEPAFNRMEPQAPSAGAETEETNAAPAEELRPARTSPESHPVQNASAETDGEPSADKARRILEGILTRMQDGVPSNHVGDGRGDPPEHPGRRQWPPHRETRPEPRCHPVYREQSGPTTPPTVTR